MRVLIGMSGNRCGAGQRKGADRVLDLVCEPVSMKEVGGTCLPQKVRRSTLLEQEQ